MKHAIASIFRIALFSLSVFLFQMAFTRPLSEVMNMSIILGGVSLVFPIVWVGRIVLEHNRSASGVNWITTFVQFAVGTLLGLGIIRAVVTHSDWSRWVLPVPPMLGMLLTYVSGAAVVLTVANLALKGLGAPFYIVLSRRLAADWMYAWTRNPMVLASLACILSLGIWFQSVMFVLWAVILFSPALLFFVKMYEERELELRFGVSYLQYKSKTPLLFPRRPRA